MKKVILYECNKCHTLLYNNTCMCGNAGAILDKTHRVTHLYVDDITTVSPMVCYINDEGTVVKRINTLESVGMSIKYNINNPKEYKKYSDRYCKS